jgi:hypothetical protein
MGGFVEERSKRTTGRIYGQDIWAGYMGRIYGQDIWAGYMGQSTRQG